MVGFAFCGSFCSFKASLFALTELVNSGIEIQPIMSETAYNTDTRFYKKEDIRSKIEELTKRKIIHTVEGAEPFGAIAPLSELIICPATGNTVSKLALGITDTAVTMAAKAHLRCDRPLLIALASNDGMSQTLKNIGLLLNRKSVFFVPMRQDDPEGKPHSLVSDFSRVTEAYEEMKNGRQIRPLFV